MVTICTAQWSLYVPHSGHYMYRTAVTICTSLTFNNSTFCPHSVFMCFVWISEQTAIISLYSINWLICVTERESVFAARYGLSLTYSSRASHREGPSSIPGLSMSDLRSTNDSGTLFLQVKHGAFVESSMFNFICVFP